MEPNRCDFSHLFFYFENEDFRKKNDCFLIHIALEFHHEDPNQKEFKLGSGNTMAWKEYEAEAMTNS